MVRAAVRHVRFGSRIAVWALALLSVMAVASPAKAETSLTMISDSGDYIGGGQTQFYTLSDGAFFASWNTGRVSISFNTPTYSHWWYLNFAAPSGQPLTVGTYYGATRDPFQASGEPGLDVYGDGRGCNMLTGSFEVKNAVYGSGNSLVSFWAVFEQHCEGSVPALRGNIRYNVDVPLAVTAPLQMTVEKTGSLSFEVSAKSSTDQHATLGVSGIPAGATFTDHGDNTGTFQWTPGFSQTGDYTLVFHGEDGLGNADGATTRISVVGITSLLMDSDPGDYIGAGQLLFLTPEDGHFYASKNYDNGVSLTFYSEAHTWYLDFAAPQNALLSVGTYEGALRFPFQGSSRAGMDISGDGRGCNTLTGRFEVKQVVYGTGSTIQAFWATFEQHCEGSTPALRGEIRFRADVPLLVRAPSAIEGSETLNLSFPVVAASEDGAHFTLTASGLPPGALFTDNGDNSGTFDWSPSRGQAGDYSVTFLAEDGQGRSERSFTRIHIALVNDDFDNAVEISSLPFTDQFEPAFATMTTDDPACYFQAPTVWYRITPAQSMTLELSVDSDYTPGLSIYTGSRGALTSIACMGTNRLVISAVAGQTYFIMVSASPYAGPVTVSVDALPPPPPNDDISGATQIGSLPFEDALDTRTASPDAGDPICTGSGATVWYQLTLTQDLLIDANTFGSDYFTSFSAYTGTPGALTQIQCAYDHLTFNGKAGVTYYFLVGSYYDEPGGHLKLSIVGLPPFTLDLAVSPVDRVQSSSGVLYLKGTITCSRPSNAYISGQVQQRIGRAIVSGSFELETACDAHTTWGVVVTSANGLFTAGKADVQVSAVAYDFRTGEYLEDQVSTSISLHGAGRKSTLGFPVVGEPSP